MDTLRKILAFCEEFSTPPSEILIELERETFLNTISPHMLAGHLQGQLLSFLSWLLNPEVVLEIGTFTGYATICLAKGLRQGGVVHTIEVNQELSFISKKYFEKAGLSEKIVLHEGDAFDIIPGLDLHFDLVFIDAGKSDNQKFYDIVFDKVKPGGLIITDNVLWDGKVMNRIHENDTDARNIEAFIKSIHNDNRVENILLPVRDGLMVARKLP
jgi:predicted O-methyltransferase YrrM